MSDYLVNAQGIITSPGKFEGECRYVPDYWQRGLDGCADLDDGSIFGFEIVPGPEDTELYPELREHVGQWLALEEDGNGFVRATILSKAELVSWLDSVEDEP